MNKEKFVEILAGAAKLYGKELDKDTMEMWLSFFSRENTIDEFKQAMNEHIKTSNFFPTIADIKSKIYRNTHTEEESNVELWDKLLNAIGNSSYHSEKEFEKLPLILQRYVGSPNQLQEMATMDSDVIHSVVKGQFLKQIEHLKESYKEYEIIGRNDLLTNHEIFQIEEVK